MSRKRPASQDPCDREHKEMKIEEQVNDNGAGGASKESETSADEEVFLGFKQEKDNNCRFRYRSTRDRFSNTLLQFRKTFAFDQTKLDFVDKVEPLLKQIGYLPDCLIENYKKSFETNDLVNRFNAYQAIAIALDKMKIEILDTQNELNYFVCAARYRCLPRKDDVSETTTFSSVSSESETTLSDDSVKAVSAYMALHEPKSHPCGPPTVKLGNQDSLKGTYFEGREILTADRYNHLTCTNLKKEERTHLLRVKNQYGYWLANAKNVYRRNEEGENKHKMDLEVGIRHVSDLMSGKAVMDESKMYCPPMVAFEVNGTRPAIKALIEAINEDDDEDDSNLVLQSEKSEPSELTPSTKPDDDQDGLNRRRRTQRTLTGTDDKTGRFQIVMPDSTMRLPVEVETLFGKTYHNVGPKGRIIRRLAKYLFLHLHFRGIGYSSFGTGVICTLCYVQVVQYYLLIETADKKGKGMIKRFRMASNYLPLISLKDFEAWEQKHNPGWQRKNARHLKKLKQKLYGDNLGDGISKSGIPIGILALHSIMKEPRGRIFGPDVDAKYREVVGKPDLRIEGLLGQGNQGVVLGAQQSKNSQTDSYVIKTCDIGTKEFFVHEGRILKELGQLRQPSSSPKDFISILESEIELKVQLGSCTETVPALLLSPQGIPLLHYLLSKNSSREGYGIAKAVWFQGKIALDYIHGKGIVHNDISPKNFVVVPDKTLKLCLVDFATACPIGYELPRYVGTTPYSHDDLLNIYPNGYKPMAEYDKYGLAVTSLVTLDGGKYRWDVNSSSRVILLENRAEALEDILSEMKELELEYNVEETEFRDEVQEWVDWKTETGELSRS